MKVEVRAVGLPAGSSVGRVNEAVAPETSQPALPVTLPDGATIDDLLQRAGELGVPVQDVNEILLNGRVAGLTDPLHDGDAVILIGQTKGD